MLEVTFASIVHKEEGEVEAFVAGCSSKPMTMTIVALHQYTSHLVSPHWIVPSNLYSGLNRPKLFVF